MQSNALRKFDIWQRPRYICLMELSSGWGIAAHDYIWHVSVTSLMATTFINAFDFFSFTRILILIVSIHYRQALLYYIYIYCQCLGMWCDFRIRWILSVSMVTVHWCKFFSCVVLIGMLVTDYTKFNDPVLNLENSAHEWKKSVHEIVYNWSLL